MERIEERNKYILLENIAFVLLCILMADCSIFGAGHIIAIGPISFRMIVVALIILVTLPIIVFKANDIIRNKCVVIFICFGVWLTISAIIGFRNGNNINILVSDLKGFAYFFILPSIVYLLSSKSRIAILMKVIMYSSAFLSLVALIHLFIDIFAPILFDRIVEAELYLMFSRIAIIASGMPRLFFHSEMYLLSGCIFAIFFQIKDSGEKLNVIYALITGINLFVLLVSYTRSVYLGALITALIIGIGIVIYYPKCTIIKAAKHILLALVVLVLLVGAFKFITGNNYFLYAVSRTFSIELDCIAGDAKKFNEDTEASDNVRAETIMELKADIKEHPIIGNGLGNEIKCREGGINEYFYLDLWAKTGIIGVIIYILPILWMLLAVMKDIIIKTREKEHLIIWLGTLIGFATFSYYNPYMNAALGVLYYCCTLGVAKCLENKNILVEKENV